MKVTLWAHTVITPALRQVMEQQDDATDADTLGEASGRACYRSFHRPNPATATTGDYLAHILDVKHHSVLAHASATFYIEDVSRALTHELVRSRFLAFSQASQRYIDEGAAPAVIPPAVRDLDLTRSGPNNALRAVKDAQAVALATYRLLVEDLLESGLPRKQAREAARAVLPNATATSIVVSGNLRAWRDLIVQRNAPGADAEIRELAGELLRQLSLLAPGTFQDLTSPVTSS